MTSASLEATARGYPTHNRMQDLFESHLMQSDHDAISLPTNDCSSLHQASPGITPAAFMDQPLLDDHRRQFCIQFAENAPGLLAAPFVDLAVLFPQAKESLDLPAQPQQHQRFG